MKLTKEQFRAQFKYGPVNFEGAGFGGRPVYSETIHGYKIFRALQLLVLQDDDGLYYVSRLS